jgi:hypothetical protein
MKGLVSAALLTAALSLPSSAAAQQPPPMPAGHPPVTGAAASAPAAPPEQDAILPSPEIPAGTIIVRLVSDRGDPLPNHEVRLGIVFQKISEGEQRKEEKAKTYAKGVARFSGLTSSSDFSYRVLVRSGPAEYASDPVQLKPDMGVVALMHVYPVTRNINEASVASRGFIYVETRDDVFQFEVLFRVFNMGGITWVPEGAMLQLPQEFKAFKAGDSGSDVRFEEVAGRGARLAGTFSPGQHNVSFRFQVPREEESHASFRFALPPHVAEIRVIAEAAPSMQLDIDGFERPQTDVNQNGQRVVVTRHVAQRGEPELGSFTVVLSGIPTPGPGRWVAVLIAAALAALGFGVWRGIIAQETQADLQERDAERAKQVLLDELVDLTRARRQERIGPSTFENARRALVEALSRIVSAQPGLDRKSKKSGSGKGRKKPKQGDAEPGIRPSGPASTA